MKLWSQKVILISDKFFLLVDIFVLIKLRHSNTPLKSISNSFSNYLKLKYNIYCSNRQRRITARPWRAKRWVSWLQTSSRFSSQMNSWPMQRGMLDRVFEKDGTIQLKYHGCIFQPGYLTIVSCKDEATAATRGARGDLIPWEGA